jgi:hypothetical protein
VKHVLITKSNIAGVERREVDVERASARAKKRVASHSRRDLAIASIIARFTVHFFLCRALDIRGETVQMLTLALVR